MSNMPIDESLLADIKEMTCADGEYERARDYYEGTASEIYASAKVQRELAKSNLESLENLNYAAIPVDVVVNRLEINAITATSEAGEPSEANAAIVETWSRNQLDFEAPTAHKYACEYGDSYAFAWPRWDEDGNPTSIDIDINAPFGTRVFYDAERGIEKTHVVRVWPVVQTSPNGTKSNGFRLNVYYPDRTERWITKPGMKGKNAGEWIPYTADGKDATIPNPFGVLPVFHFRTDRPYGRPEHRSAFVPQTLINKLVISQAATVDYLSFPQRYGLIDPTKDDAAGRMDFDADYPMDSGATPEDSDNPSTLKSGPGQFWELPGYRDVGEFSAANPSNFLEPLNRYVLAMSEVTQIPWHYFNPSGETPSGRALRIKEGPLTKRVANRQVSFGATWRELFEFVLTVFGFEDARVTVDWKPAESTSAEDEIDLAAAKKIAGVPERVALLEAGYTEEQMDTWPVEEQENAA